MSNVIDFPSRRQESTTELYQSIKTTTTEVYRLQTPAMFEALTEQVRELLKSSFDFSDESVKGEMAELVSCLKEIHSYPSEYPKTTYPELTALAFRAIQANQTELVQNPVIIEEIRNTEKESTHPSLKNRRKAAAAVLKVLEAASPDLPPAS